MSDWSILNAARVRTGQYASDESFGFNGKFILTLPPELREVVVISSDGLGWQHVSVSFGHRMNRTPSWLTMCQIKDLFWEPEDTVVQFHPPKSEHINNHPGCLHLWRPTDQQFPSPPGLLVGLKGITFA